MNILKKIEQAGLVGRGGGDFLVAEKWRTVADTPSSEKYIVCNAAEGEPGIKKDGHILENHPERVIEGMRLARKFLEHKNRELKVKSYIYINYYYFKKFEHDLKEFIKEEDDIEFFLKPDESGYIGGEESAILNILEKKRAEPRLRPPFPTTQGLWEAPTIVNNVETFYNVSLVNRDEYRGNRFYTIGGRARNKGVYCLPTNWTIEKILKQSGNYPKFSFFVQVGGDVSGKVWLDDQLKRKAGSAGSITIYKLKGHSPEKLIKKWLTFFVHESCGKCTPCREGVYQLVELMKKKKVNWHLLKDLLNNLDESSFCGLGKVVPVPISFYIKNILCRAPAKDMKISEQEITRIQECFNK